MRGWNPIPNNQSHCNFLSKIREGVRVRCTEQQWLASFTLNCLGTARLYNCISDQLSKKVGGTRWNEGLGLLLGDKKQLARNCATLDFLCKLLLVHRLLSAEILWMEGTAPCSGIYYFFFIFCHILARAVVFHSQMETCVFLCWILASRIKSTFRLDQD